MTKEEIEDDFFWQIRLYAEGSMSLLDLLEAVYSTGLEEGYRIGRERGYWEGLEVL